LTHLLEFGIGSLYSLLQSVCEFCEYKLIERHTLLVGCEWPAVFIFHFILIKFGRRDVRKNVLVNCELHENESHSLLKGINKLLTAFSKLFVCFG
jgi:hypothetical protein